MRTKRKAIDLIAHNSRQCFAIEIETGKNSNKQIMDNIIKCLGGGTDKLYLLATNNYAYRKINNLLREHAFINRPRICLVKADRMHISTPSR